MVENTVSIACNCHHSMQRGNNCSFNCSEKVEVVLLLPYRQNVVIGGAGRFSRSAKFATSSELLYLLNLLYNIPSECCDEYKLIQLIPVEFRVVFRFLTYIFHNLPRLNSAYRFVTVEYAGADSPNVSFISVKISCGVSHLNKNTLLLL